MPETFTLPRTGAAPLRFEGERLAEVSTRLAPGNQERNRWFKVELYRTRGGRYVLAIGYRTQWQGEHSTDRAIPCHSAEEVRQELSLFRPLEDVAGYPPGDAYRDKQERLERLLTLDWQTAVRDLFAQAEEEFAERVE